MIDWTRPIEMVDGRKARVLATDFKCGSLNCPIAVAIECPAGLESFMTLASDGMLHGKPYIRNIPEKLERTVWWNVYENGVFRVGSYLSSEDAGRCAAPNRIACIRTTITGTVGQFDE